jgi:hypothetical protein
MVSKINLRIPIIVALAIVNLISHAALALNPQPLPPKSGPTERIQQRALLQQNQQLHPAPDQREYNLREMLANSRAQMAKLTKDHSTSPRFDLFSGSTPEQIALMKANSARTAALIAIMERHNQAARLRSAGDKNALAHQLQTLLAQYNQARQLESATQKKQDDTSATVSKNAAN